VSAKNSHNVIDVVVLKVDFVESSFEMNGIDIEKGFSLIEEKNIQLIEF
jgi:hypothetical protein